MVSKCWSNYCLTHSLLDNKVDGEPGCGFFSCIFFRIFRNVNVTQIKPDQRKLDRITHLTVNSCILTATLNSCIFSY